MELSTPKVIDHGNGQIHVQHGTDAGLRVTFSLEPIEDSEQSAKAGRPIFKDQEIITIRIVGDNSRVIVRPVKYHDDAQSPSDPNRFAAAWMRYKNQHLEIKEGTPLTEWPPISKSQAMTLKGMNIHTVEDLAVVSDGNLNWMGARELQRKAITFLKQAQSGSELSRVESENADLKKQLTAMQNQMNAIQENLSKKAEKNSQTRKKEDE